MIEMANEFKRKQDYPKDAKRPRSSKEVLESLGMKQ